MSDTGDLRQIVDEYIERMEGICERKISLAEKQLDYELAEMRAFNTLRQKLLVLDGADTGNAIPEDQFFVPSDWEDPEPGDGRDNLGSES